MAFFGVRRGHKRSIRVFSVGQASNFVPWRTFDAETCPRHERHAVVGCSIVAAGIATLPYLTDLPTYLTTYLCWGSKIEWQKDTLQRSRSSQARTHARTHARATAPKKEKENNDSTARWNIYTCIRTPQGDVHAERPREARNKIRSKRKQRKQKLNGDIVHCGTSRFLSVFLPSLSPMRQRSPAICDDGDDDNDDNNTKKEQRKELAQIGKATSKKRKKKNPKQSRQMLAIVAVILAVGIVFAFASTRVCLCVYGKRT